MKYRTLSLLALCITVSAGTEARSLNMRDIDRLQKACEKVSAIPTSGPIKAHGRGGKGRNRAMARLCSGLTPPPAGPISGPVIGNPTPPPVVTPPPSAPTPPPVFTTPPVIPPVLSTIPVIETPIGQNPLPINPTAPSAVPVPAAAWLFGSGLLGLIGLARRRRTTTRC